MYVCRYTSFPSFTSLFKRAQEAAAAAAAALSLRRAAVLGAHVPAAGSDSEAVLGPAQEQRVLALQRLQDGSNHIVRDRGSNWTWKWTYSFTYV